MNTTLNTVSKEFLFRILIEARGDIANFRKNFICTAIEKIGYNNPELQQHCFEILQALKKHIGMHDTLTTKIMDCFLNNYNDASTRWCRLKWIDFFCRELDEKEEEIDLLCIVEAATEKLRQRIISGGVRYVYHKL